MTVKCIHLRNITVFSLLHIDLMFSPANILYLFKDHLRLKVNSFVTPHQYNANCNPFMLHKKYFL